MKKRILIILSACLLASALPASELFAAAKPTPKPGWPKIMTAAATPPQTVAGIMATAVAKNVEDKLGVPMTTTVGHTVERAFLMQKGEAEMGMLGSDVLYAGVRGIGDFKGKGKVPVRFITTMYPQLLHILSRKPVKSFTDLKGLKCMFDNPATPMQMDMIDALLKFHGMTRKDIVVVKHTRSEEVSDALIAGTVDVGIRIGQLAGTATVRNLVSKTNIHFLSLTEAEQDAVAREAPFFGKYTMKAGIYKGQNQPVNVAGLAANWVVRADLPDDLVYGMAKILMDSAGKDTPGDFTKYHPNLSWTLQDNVDFLYKKVAPFHPGMVKYLKERGVWNQEMDNIQAELLKIAH